MNTDNLTLPPCPVCGGTELKTAASEPGLTIIRCAGCSMLFSDPYCSQFTEKCGKCGNRCLKPDSAAPGYYAALSITPRLRLEKKRLERIRAVTGAVFTGKRVLEIGSGVGALASLLHGEGADYTGLEPVKMFYEKSVKSFPGLASRIKNIFLTGAALPEKHFDIIIAADVLEYVAGPVALLARLKSHLRPGGRIYLEVPNETFFLLRTWLRARLGLYSSLVHPGHVNFFNRKTMRLAAGGAGLRVASLRQISLLSDEERLRLTLKKELPAWLKAASWAARRTRFDLPLQQGNFVCVCGGE